MVSAKNKMVGFQKETDNFIFAWLKCIIENAKRYIFFIRIKPVLPAAD